MKKIILIVAIILTSFSLLSFNSLNKENFKSIDVKKLTINNDLEEDECQEYAFGIIRNLYKYSNFTLQELADYETFLLTSCYYDA